MRPSVVAGKGLGFRRLGRMADYGGGDDDAIDDAILRKYFGVHDKSLRELYTSTSSDATFYKVGVLATPPIPASAGARARACQRSDPLSLSRSSAPDAKKKAGREDRKEVPQVEQDRQAQDRVLASEALPAGGCLRPRVFALPSSPLTTLLLLPHHDEQTSNYDWKKNRNHYAELLLDMLERGKLEFPFDKRPEEGPLKTLPSYLRPCAAAGPRSQGGPPKHASSKDGSAKPDRRDDVVHIASAAVDVLHDRNISRSVLSSVDGNSISGFRYDAEIQLGACRERCLELEMQVTARNDKIARLEKELIRARSDHRRDVHKYKTKVRRHRIESNRIGSNQTELTEETPNRLTIQFNSMRWTRLQINALKETYTKNLGKIIKRYTLHFKNNAARARAREADSEKQRDVPDDDRPRDEESLETAQVGDRAQLGAVFLPSHRPLPAFTAS